jgi:hypothetical protein
VTTPKLLIGLAALAGAIGWGVGSFVMGQAGRIVPVPWLAPMTMGMLALGLLMWTLLSRPRLLHHPGSQPMPPIVAARTAALAMAASRTGALIGGFYLGVLLSVVPRADTQTGLTTLWAAGFTTAAAICLTVVAVWLERMCQLPAGDDS